MAKGDGRESRGPGKDECPYGSSAPWMSGVCVCVVVGCMVEVVLCGF